MQNNILQKNIILVNYIGFVLILTRTALCWNLIKIDFVSPFLCDWQSVSPLQANLNSNEDATVIIKKARPFFPCFTFPHIVEWTHWLLGKHNGNLHGKLETRAINWHAMPHWRQVSIPLKSINLHEIHSWKQWTYNPSPASYM